MQAGRMIWGFLHREEGIGGPGQGVHGCSIDNLSMMMMMMMMMTMMMIILVGAGTLRRQTGA